MDGIQLGEVLRNAYDEFWTENPPKDEHGSPGYYEWYKQQNEFVASSLLKAIEYPIYQSNQELSEIKYILSRRDALSYWNGPLEKIGAMLHVLEKLDPHGIAMKAYSEAK